MTSQTSHRRARAVAIAASETSTSQMSRGELMTAWLFGLACILATLSGLPL